MARSKISEDQIVESAKHTALVERALSERISDSAVVQKLATELLRGAEEGLELNVSFENWFTNRFKPQLVWLDENDYTRALVRALWLARTFAGTDYGTSRQRDMAQIWTDTARGFVGEIAVAHFLQSKFGVESRVDTSRGHVSRYLATDIAEIRMPGSDWRPPRLRISVKTTKFNGRWLDAPGAQLSHSDVFILTKLGITRQHFLRFLRGAGFIESLIARAKDLQELSESDAEALRREIPASHPLPAYIAGWIDKRKLTFPIHMLNAEVFGRTKKRILVKQGIGLMTPDAIRKYPSIAAVGESTALPIEIAPIIKSFTGQKFLAHSGGMSYGKRAWELLLNQL